MIIPYSGDVLRTYETVTNNRPSYRYNTLYKANNGHLYYINRKGYLHTYQVQKGRFNGKTIYFLLDMMLTTDNVLKESGRREFYTKESIIEYISDMEKEAANNNQEDM